jgi:hypothetical protein
VLVFAVTQACRSDHDSQGGIGSGLSREVSTALNDSFEGTPNQRFLITNFLNLASSNEDRNFERPLLLLSSGQKLEWGAITTGVQLSIIKNSQYRFLEVRPGSELIVTFSSILGEVSRSSIETIFSSVKTLLPQIDVLLGNHYTTKWLHIQLIDSVDLNVTVGSNVCLSNSLERTEQVIAHELVHTFNSRWAGIPIFIKEGLAEFVSFEITSASFHQPAGVPPKVHLSVTGVIPSQEYARETRGGLEFFKALENEMGRDALLSGVVEGYLNGPVNGVSILSAIKKHAPSRERMEVFYRNWIDDYQPDAV